MSEYDRRAQEWVRQRYGVTPDPGSVEFHNDCAAYHSDAWAEVDVSWTVDGRVDAHTLNDSAWQYDWTQIIRELVEIELS